MNQNDTSIFEKTNIQSSALMINQCNVDNYWENKRDYGNLKIISTKERGLSNSRNMAIKNASQKYALLCDDDEYLYEGYPQIIENAFNENPHADILCFQIKRSGKKYSNKGFKVGFLSSLKIASWQICFKVESIKKADVFFDKRFGSGTSLGAGEENIFLYDCLKKKLKCFYVPICIGEVAQIESKWFKGFNQLYFYNRGVATRRMMGLGGFFYCLYFLFAKHYRYKSETSFINACRNIYAGFFSRLSK